MSNFRDTFTKQEKRDNLLDYDDSAFLFFGGTVLACILVPWTWKLMRSLFAPIKKRQTNVKYCQCSFCVNKVENQKKSKARWSTVISARFLSQLIVVVALWMLTIYVGSLCAKTRSIQTFDPFEILELPLGATDKQIKKQYRVMSLKFHPDKNINDPTAGAKFIMISKAYQALTDEISKKNYEKFGNPDGPTAMKVGIGLPRFLVEESNQLFFLILFFIALLIIIPLIFIYYYRRMQSYAENGVQLETMHFLGYMMSDGTRIRNGPELLAASAESRELTIRPSDNDDMQKIVMQVVEPRKRQFNLPIIVRNYFLILAHMQRLHRLITDNLRRDLNHILSKSEPIISAMLEISLMSNWFNTAISLLDFQRSLLHCLAFRNLSLLQIPHVDESTLTQCNKGGKTPIRELQDLVAQREDIASRFAKMNQSQLADMEAFCAHIPDVEVAGEVFVDDEKEIVVNDVVTVAVKMVRKNLRDGELTGPIHAPLFPVTKMEQWWICVVVNHGPGSLVGYVKVRSREKVVEERIQFQAQKAGKQELTVHFLCDSYSGVDKSIKLAYKVFTEKEVTRTTFVHPEDEALDDEPTLFQQMIGQLGAEHEGSDIDEEDGKQATTEMDKDTDESSTE